ncbi:hypothetical protein CLV60_11650 [Dyadobacter jiangsuensis]|uniref:Uncharacterized protein n=2 Tax=Dyadobacter jiangsuensis TaxID=1591085 RepID=A0A2P8FPA7_9BACT|nr:hypothetical protein CLV60_11650 [Dyadobacter jiangsuensis]
MNQVKMWGVIGRSGRIDKDLNGCPMVFKSKSFAQQNCYEGNKVVAVWVTIERKAPYSRAVKTIMKEVM